MEKHTQVDGAVLHAATGDLKLDTGTLSVTTILDHDTGTSYNAQVGLNTPGAPGKLPGANLQGSYATHDTEQETRGTIGSGEIVIRDTAKQKQDVAKVNRDPEKAQVIVKDERSGVQVYVSDSAIRTAVDVLEKAGATLKDAFSATFDDRKDIDPQTKKAAGKLLDDMLSGKVKPDDLKGCLQQGFNLHDLLFTRAYAAGACGGHSKQTVELCLGFLDNMRAGLVTKGADFVDTFKQRLKEDPQGFEKFAKLLDLTPSAFAMAPLEEKIKAQIGKNGDDVKAITAAVGSFLAEQQQMLENGEISQEVALAAAVGTLVLTFKLTPKATRNEVMEKAGNLVGDVLNVVRNKTPDAAGAQNIANAARLADQLSLQSARSPFTSDGTLTKAALQNARMIMAPERLNNPAIPAGFAKYVSETFQSPSGPFQMHFYKNSTTGQVL